MAILTLGDGNLVQVDDGDVGLARSREWRVIVTNRSPRVYRYVAVFVPDDGSFHTVYLHREILGAVDGQAVRFRDGDGLNCRRENLLLVGGGR